MPSLFSRLKQPQRPDFHGGIHPPENKDQTCHQTILPCMLAPELILPLRQHIGSAGQLLVSAGDKVKKGQALTQSLSQHTCPIHAPTSGIISAIEPRVISHPSGLSETCIILQTDGADTWGEKPTIPDVANATSEILIEHLRQMGIAGLGGAGFPTARKIQTGLGRTDLIIINGAECEPYITADDRLMQERAAEIIQGAEILQQILQPSNIVFALEDNKPDAIHALTQAIPADSGIRLQVVPTKYPSGGEKQLIELLTGKQVPSGSIPADLGILMQNIATVFAIKRAVMDGEPLIERVVTFVGKQLEQQANRWCLLGTPITFLLEQHGYQPACQPERIIIGGPMMGFTAPTSAIPVTKLTNCVLVPTLDELPSRATEQACIRCSACAEVCPASLLPQQLLWYARQNDQEKCQQYHLSDCIECGACAYVCPSDIPLVQVYREAKAAIRQDNAEQAAAELAKQRFEAKKARMTREKLARETRHKEAALQRQQAGNPAENQDAINAAIARVQAKTSSTAADNTNADNTPDKKSAVAAAIARAKAKQLSATTSEADPALPDNSQMRVLREARKQQAREQQEAKARAERDSPTAEPVQPTDPAEAKKAAVAAAIARAKAKQANAAKTDVAQDATTSIDAKATPSQQNATPCMQTDPAEAKKAAVAAAIERAKAKQANAAKTEVAQEVPTATEAKVAPSEQNATPSKKTDPAEAKKAAVAAAIARAKARKAAQSNQEDNEK